MKFSTHTGFQLSRWGKGFSDACRPELEKPRFCAILYMTRVETAFISFWKEITVQKIMEYLVNNSYTVSLDGIKRSLSIDQKFEDNHFVIDVIHEKDDHKVKQRKIFEIKNLIMRNEELFDPQEITLLNFILDGYTLAELEHSGMMSRSTLYHMFNTAVEKLQKLIKRIKGNKC